MRDIHIDQISETVARLFIDAAHNLPDDVVAALERARDSEESPLGRQVLEEILENAKLASAEMIPLCQDTGTSVVFVELGQEVHVVGGTLEDAVNRGVAKGYTEGYLRKSMVTQPFSARKNTGDNTPAVIHLELVPGDRLRIKTMPKGGGCENMSRMTILLPGQGREGIANFVLRAVEEASGNPCPPLVVGVGIGGSAEYCMALAKKAITRRVGSSNPDAENADLERDLLEKVNALGLGPQAVGGTNTALAVHVETFPTHITALPVAVNMQCHSARIKEAEL
ncbi:MAG: fumarate hydratase [Dehalococcoidia bacterium]|nr:fumarate hydratase [Dehalococcoidia bacterium]